MTEDLDTARLRLAAAALEAAAVKLEQAAQHLYGANRNGWRHEIETLTDSVRAYERMVRDA